MAFTAGGAVRTINCKIGDGIAGQLHNRICSHIHDDLEANAFFLSDGKETILMINCDLLGLERVFTEGTASAIEAKIKIPAKNIMICCTHTHAGPYTSDFLFDVPRNDAYLKDLKARLVELAQDAAGSAKPARIGWALGKAHIGFNRRLCWEDGTHSMYGDPKRPDFNGIEGPDDDSHAILFATGENNEIIAIAHNNACHSTCFEIANFASADFPGAARAELRSALGKRVPVLYIQGASGDISPWNMLDPKPRADAEQRAKEIGSLMSAETIVLMNKAEMHDGFVLRHEFEDMKIAVRLPGEKEFAHAKKIVEMGVEKAGRWDYVLQESALRLYKEFKDDPFDTVPVHAVRIGDLAIATNPCELYCQFGLDIKRRSPAKITMVSQLTSGSMTYCPTIPAVMGGGYSGDAILWCRLEPCAGYKIVETTSRLLYRMWRD